MEDEIEPVESSYMAFGTGNHVKLQLTPAHVREVTMAAMRLKRSFILLEQFNSLCCLFKLEAQATPVGSELLKKNIFPWLSAFSRVSKPVLADNMGKQMVDMTALLKRAAEIAPVGSDSRLRLGRAQA